ncbi:MAG: hypothetical protein IJ284_04305 [Clostridia bacterium]|nr:hypothetical protein [Clostridia bacterium]
MTFAKEMKNFMLKWADRCALAESKLSGSVRFSISQNHLFLVGGTDF